ncbi:MAG TPA: laccase domain-containing protein [Intrasporangiaceae bacterium]|nr:laccase domain-containing protein [Intrasporangiaceae bacterium]
MWWWSQRRDRAVLGFTRRGHGGSTGRYRGCNLGAHVEDDPATVTRNRTAVVDAVSSLAGVESTRVTPVFMQQVHGASVRVIEDLSQVAPAGPGADPCDAVVTTLPHVALFSLVADCTPVLFTDAGAGVVAAAHAGRPGMLAGIIPETVAAMRDLGAERIQAVVGPSVCPRCYEVPETMRAQAMTVEPVSGSVTWTGTPAIDVAAGVVAQLRRDGIEVTWVPGCTRESDDLYSYRRDGPTGRFAGVVMRAPDLMGTDPDPTGPGAGARSAHE